MDEPILMLNDSAQTRQILNLIVRRVRVDPSQHEDLLQEASIHLWQQLERQPGQRRSWYLQSCFDHLRNYVRRGRSIDSLRRQQFVENGERSAADGNYLSASAEDVVASVCAQDLMESLAKWLTPAEWQTLNCLAEGLSLRETATRLNTSHTTINKHRRKIETLVLKLDGSRLLTHARTGTSRLEPQTPPDYHD